METLYNKRGVSEAQIGNVYNIENMDEQISIDAELKRLLKEAGERMLKEFSKQMDINNEKEMQVFL